MRTADLCSERKNGIAVQFPSVRKHCADMLIELNQVVAYYQLVFSS